MLAACVGAILESLNSPSDDNLRVPLGVVTVLWLAGHFLSYSTRELPRETPVQPEVFITALAINLAADIANPVDVAFPPARTSTWTAVRSWTDTTRCARRAGGTT